MKSAKLLLAMAVIAGFVGTTSSAYAKKHKCKEGDEKCMAAKKAKSSKHAGKGKHKKEEPKTEEMPPAPPAEPPQQ